jgi:predicted nucleic acid-binding protein
MTAQRRFLADTNLVSFALMHKMGCLKKQMDIDAAVWYEAITRDTKAILSFATVAELRRWINSIKDQAERDRIAKVVVPCIESSYRIQSNDAIAESWAMIAKKAKARGRMSKPSPLG